MSGEPVEQTALKEAAEEMGSIVKLSSCQVVKLSSLSGVFHCACTSENSFGADLVFGGRAYGRDPLVNKFSTLRWLPEPRNILETAIPDHGVTTLVA